jgi:hypothetical protein
MPKPFVVVRALLVQVLALPACFPGAAAWSGPVVCTTTLEAPPMIAAGKPGAGAADASELNPAGPLEVTRCVAVETTSQLVRRRFNTYSAPFAQGISITNQITDLLGIAMGGDDGTRVMGFGFPDQTIVWDATALENTYRVLLEQSRHQQRLQRQPGLHDWIFRRGLARRRGRREPAGARAVVDPRRHRTMWSRFRRGSSNLVNAADS